MNLNQYWRLEYEKDTYMQHMSDSEVSARARYLIENLTTLELNSKIGLRAMHTTLGRDLMRKFTHVLHELHLRNSGFQKQFMADASVSKAMLNHEKQLKKLNQYAAEKRPHLFKFGKIDHFDKSSFKVSLASSFSDPSLNPSQRDDELALEYLPNPKEVKLTKLNGEAIEGVQHIKLNFEIKRDYYVFCSSLSFDVRLFGDFDSNACLFIYDSEQFAKDLQRLVSSSISILDHAFKPVRYIDPVRPEGGRPKEIEFCKHIKYLYQNEYRHVFIPRDTASNPKHLLHMPESKRYTEIVCL